ncbi:MAG: rane protein, partial [Solirubrobacteraceae bacterium]|nr:rane protein [Solirubrobacteraceae bacterium]
MQQASQQRERHAERDDDRDVEPDTPTELSKQSWGAVLKRTFREFKQDDITDWAAALTYYAILSLFPGLLVLVAILGLAGESAIG